ncbi:DNA-binding NarL/FixJ family response regulator [Kribbella voronezhensis]|uniref:DNA-binding NarL/FixJ family response regulator n=1 Tax=Kribbella voronezhensis TaxID=2512212 RepID=A0A4R7THD2_9ACTN|nr:response regulator transcription factor [Kribbella voronezhensis]TDU91690.1 DNA-binding NarL/FixJ family response regulator [Kribbella voronezhensis]
MNEQVRVVVADGHTLVRYGLSGLVATEPDIEVVGSTGLGREAVSIVATVRPDVLVLDVVLPDTDGLQLASELRSRYADLGIVLLASNGQDDVLFEALASGVSAFVTRAAPADEVLAAIRHAAVAPVSFTATGLASAMERRELAANQHFLSRREAEVLALLGEGLSVRAIATRLCVSLSTAKTYVARLYEKLGASNRAQAIMAAMERDLLAAKH